MPFTTDQPFQDFIDECEAREACAPAVTWARAQPRDLTTAIGLQMLGAVSIDSSPDCSGNGSAWVRWVLKTFDGELASSLVNNLIAQETNAMAAFQLFLKLRHTTTAHDRALRDIFEGELPRAERELRDGDVSRDRDRA